MAGEERLRRSMISVLNGAARGVTFGGPLVNAMNLGLPTHYTSHTFVQANLEEFLRRPRGNDDRDADSDVELEEERGMHKMVTYDAGLDKYFAASRGGPRGRPAFDERRGPPRRRP